MTKGIMNKALAICLSRMAIKETAAKERKNLLHAYTK